MTLDWPTVELDAVSRLRVLGAAVPGSFVCETVLDAPFDVVWAVASDLENELPAYLTDVRSFLLTRVDGDALEAQARGYAGLRARFDVVLRPGWCVMRSRFLLGGLAAVADGEQTRFALLGGMHVPAQRLVAPALGRMGQALGRRAIGNFTHRVRLRCS